MNINERSTAYLTVRFYAKDGSLAAPTAVVYSIHDLTNGQEVRAETALVAGAEIEITLTTADTAIINDNNQFERRLVIVEATYGVDDAVRSQYEFQVYNLKKVV